MGARHQIARSPDVVVGVALAALLSCSGCQRDLDPAIGAPEWGRVESVRDYREWLNPHLSVCSDNISLTVRSVSEVSRTVRVAELRESLVALPVTAWPFGRIIRVQGCSFGWRGQVDDSKTLQEVESILTDLHLEIRHISQQ